MGIWEGEIPKGNPDLFLPLGVRGELKREVPQPLPKFKPFLSLPDTCGLWPAKLYVFCGEGGDV